MKTPEERAGLSNSGPGPAGWRLPRAGTVAIFVAVLLAYVVQTELAQAVQRSYAKPVLLLFLSHSAYVLLFPLHLLALGLLGRPTSLAVHLAQLRQVLVCQAAPDDDLPTRPAFPYAWLLRRSAQLAALIALPSLCWYAAVPFADMTSITAIYNTNACFAYLFALRYLDTEAFELRKTAGVVASLVGVLLVSFGGSSTEAEDVRAPSKADGPMRLVGTGLAFVGSVSYAAYEVWYKRLIALPEPETAQSFCQGEPDSEDTGSDDAEIINESSLFLPQAAGKPINSKTGPIISQLTIPIGLQTKLLYANLMTTMIGVMTLGVGWVPIPVLDRLGIEPFEGPPDKTLWLMIGGMVAMGVVFNAGFMVLLGLWGPVTASVGNLCTLVLIAIVDRTAIGTINNGGMNVAQPVSAGLVGGCLLIIAGFSIVLV